MKFDYTKVIPQRYHTASYETDVRDEIKEIATRQIQSRNGLYIYGEVGSGKTHLVCALIKRLLEEDIEVRFYNTGDFIEKLREEFDRGFGEEEELSLFRETMNFKGILVFDDIGAEKMSDWVRERLYLIINKKYEDMTPMIFTSNCDMEILSARLGDRVTSRLVQMTEIIGLKGQDRRLNMKIQDHAPGK